MFRSEKVEKILAQAKHTDPKFEMFSISEHQYKLNPPVELAFVRELEENYHFRLPEDYVQFITEVGDGGAEPVYGIFSFKFFCREAESPSDKKFRETYLRGLAKEFYHGERHGQVFSVVEGGYKLKADCFQAFYQDWLDFILDTKQFQKELDMWRWVRNR